MRQGLRIQGLVRLAGMIRRELAQPVSESQKRVLARLVADSVQDIDRILVQRQTTIKNLPTPTRLAYEFLAGLDIERIQSTVAETEELRPREHVSFTGLASVWERFLNSMADPRAGSRADRVHEALSTQSNQLEQHIAMRGYQSQELTQRTRQIRGWLAFFAQRENFDACLEAAERARSAFEPRMGSGTPFHAPAFVQFRPVHCLYQLRVFREGTRVVLPAPMITFDLEQMTLVAEMALRRARTRQPVLEAIMSDEYQGLQAELEALGGEGEEPGGVYHNLTASFGRVNPVYFQNALGQPRLTWSRILTGRKLGHYDHIRDTVMISSTLDRSEVPEYVLDSVMHHELLHKQLGLNWHNGRMAAHTPEFRNLERRFRQFAEADAFLKRLATRRR